MGYAQNIEKINLIINYLPHRSTGNSGLQYDQLLNEVLEGENFDVTRIVAPLGRAGKLFTADLNACHYPTGRRKLTDDNISDRYIGSNPIDYFSLRLYTGMSSKNYTSVDELKTGVFGYIAGSGAVRRIPELSKSWVPIKSEEQLIHMLELNRLDGFIGHHPDTVLALEKLGSAGLVKLSDLTFGQSRVSVHVICHNNAIGKQFIDMFNRRLNEMYQAGRLKEILGVHAELPEKDE